MNCSHKPFTHIYIESAVRNDPRTKGVLNRFPSAVPVYIDRYTDVFSRSHQLYSAQTSFPNLILAKKHGTFLYRGAPVCHDFGNDRFYYTSSIINCIYNCEYCWLKGMYNTANIVLFLNIEDYFRETEMLLQEGPLYLSLSFETDLIPLEGLSGHIHAWNQFLLKHDSLTAEIRTKSGASDIYKTLHPSNRLIFAFTLSPEELIRTSEHGTGSLLQRIEAVRAAMHTGFSVRLCFDPMIRFPGWKSAYGSLIDTVSEKLDLSAVRDFSIGTYRQSETYQRRMRKRFPDDPIIQYPYETINGYCQYPSDQRNEMEQFVLNRLAEHTSRSKIYLLEESL